MDNDFNSQNNRDVINIGTNHGPINIGDKESQNNNPNVGNHSRIMSAFFICFLVFAVVLIGILISRPSIILPNQNLNTNLTSQPNAVFSNTNVTIVNSTQENSQDKSQSTNTINNGKSSSRVTKGSKQPNSTKLTNKTTRTQNKVKPDPNATPSDSILTSSPSNPE